MGVFDFLRRKTEQSSIPNQRYKRSANVVETTEQMFEDLSLAESIYANKPPWLNEEEGFADGSGIGALIAAEVAKLITIESSITVNDEEIDRVIQKYVMPNLRAEIEKGWALGGLVLKPYYNNAVFELVQNKVADIRGKLKVDFIYPSNFLIEDYDNSGRIHKIKFFTVAVQNDKYYVRVEEQDYDESARELIITNTVYETAIPPARYRWDNLGNNTVAIDSVERWRNIQPKIVFSDVDGALIGFFKPAVANNVDINSPYGASGLVRAKTAIKRIDRIYNSMAWEMEASLARLYIDETAMPPFSEMPKKLSKFIVNLLGSEGKQIFEKFAPNIREQSYLNMWDAELRHIEANIGLAHGTLSHVDNSPKTATEISSTRQRTYATVTDNQKALKTAIEQLVYAMKIWGSPAKSAVEIETVFDFDDSVISNPSEQLMQHITLQEAGNIPAYKTNMMYFGVPEDEARQLVEESRKEKFDNMSDNAESDME